MYVSKMLTLSSVLCVWEQKNFCNHHEKLIVQNARNFVYALAYSH